MRIADVHGLGLPIRPKWLLAGAIPLAVMMRTLQRTGRMSAPLGAKYFRKPTWDRNSESKYRCSVRDTWGFPLRERVRFLKIAGMFALAAVSTLLAQETQTYQIGPDASKSPQAQTQQKQNQSQQQLGWGTNIQNARIGRAAELALKKGDRTQALDFARRAVHATPNDSQLWFLLGYAARLNGRFDESVEAYNHGLRLNPSSLDGQSGLAQDLAIMGRAEDAQKMLTQIVAADPSRRDDLLLLGETYMRARNYQNAVDWLARAERLKPEARSEVLLAISYEQLKQMDVANRYLEEARHHDPNNPDVERTLAGYFRETGKYGDAINALKAIKNPHPDIVAELAYTYQLDGNMTESAKLYTRSANALPKDMALQLSAAQAEVAAGSVEDANTFLTRAEGLDPNYYRLHAILLQVVAVVRSEGDGLFDVGERAVEVAAGHLDQRAQAEKGVARWALFVEPVNLTLRGLKLLLLVSLVA